ncbi:amidase family protein (plasmid) [Embleya sp. NBC_00888]|uniref:amidase family protein n=1 Tax=Embleya sp. NBC_00888 TaxID=2975960 RepID=UPI002F910287|nr:amidase family protein [Embleya sp. NBC_00888]
MARTVADTALLLSAMAGPDPRDPTALETPGSAFAAPLDFDPRGLRVAWAPDLGGSVPVDPEVLDVLADAVAVFADLGCHVESDSPDFRGADDVFRTLRAHEFNLGLGHLLDSSRAALKPSLVWNIEEGRGLGSDDLARATIAHSRLYARGIDFFDRYDVLLAPVSQVVPFDADLEYPQSVAGVAQHTYLDWMRSAYYVTLLGAPALSVPAGFTPGGLPVGLQIVTAPRSDLTTLRIGAAFEAATRHGRRRPPRG